MEILYEDEYLIAVNKPPGLASVPGLKIANKGTLMFQVQEHFKVMGIKPYILHRLDKETSGITLFGKFPRNRELLSKIFDSSEPNGPTTKKTYLALVKGCPKSRGIITFPLKARNSNQKIPAKTSYRVLQNHGDYSLVEAEIETGRHHQIRQHLAMIGHPLVNDFDYGNTPFNRKFQKVYKTHFSFLHAKSIEFIHPATQKKLRIEAPIPKPFSKFIRA